MPLARLAALQAIHGIAQNTRTRVFLEGFPVPGCVAAGLPQCSLLVLFRIQGVSEHMFGYYTV